MKKILVILEHDNHTLKQINYAMLTAAEALDGDIHAMIIGYQCESVVEEAQRLPAVKSIKVADAEVYEHQLAENSASLISRYAKAYDYILAPASTFGKNLLPRVAALLDVGMIADVSKILSPDTFVRPIYAGNAFATVQSQEKIKCLTIRSTAFSSAISLQMRSLPIEKLTDVISHDKVTFVKQELTQSKRPELTSAKIVISGGRGLKSAENFKKIETLADCLGAAVGASRAAVDAGFAPNDYQVGQTGKIVAPDLYIALGISGAVQHLAGMKDSKVIVAINHDPDAPIFQIADYYLVTDLLTALEQLKTELC